MSAKQDCPRCARHPGFDCARCLRRFILACIVAEVEKGRMTAGQADLARGNMEENVADRRMWEMALELNP